MSGRLSSESFRLDDEGVDVDEAMFYRNGGTTNMVGDVAKGGQGCLLQFR